MSFDRFSAEERLQIDRDLATFTMENELKALLINGGYEDGGDNYNALNSIKESVRRLGGLSSLESKVRAQCMMAAHRYGRDGLFGDDQEG